MKSLVEAFGGTYTLGEDDMFHPSMTIEAADSRPIWKWGRMHRAYLKEAILSCISSSSEWNPV